MCVTSLSGQIQHIYSIYMYHLFRCKDSKEFKFKIFIPSTYIIYSMQSFKSFFIILFFYSSTLRYEIIINKSKKGKNYFFFCFFNSYIYYPEDFSVSAVALLQGALLISLPQSWCFHPLNLLSKLSCWAKNKSGLWAFHCPHPRWGER